MLIIYYFDMQDTIWFHALTFFKTIRGVVICTNLCIFAKK